MIDEMSEYKCPICEALLDWKQSYCFECGLHLGWSDAGCPYDQERDNDDDDKKDLIYLRKLFG